MRLRPHCSQAACAMDCQCAARRTARSPSRRSTVRDVISGCTAAAPSSVAFSTSQSMRSFAGMPTAKVTAGDSSRSTGRWRRISTRAAGGGLTSRASHSPPLPSNRTKASPARRRSARAWRTAAGGKSTMPATNGPER